MTLSRPLGVPPFMSLLVEVSQRAPSGVLVMLRRRPQRPEKTAWGVPTPVPAAVDLGDPELAAGDAGDVDPVVDDLHAARSGLGGRPGALRGDVAAAVADGSLAGGPAVVAALLDQVQLVLAVLAELGRPQLTAGVPREALRVAEAEAPDVAGVAAGAEERVVARRGAVGVDPQDLAVERAPVLRVAAVLRVADGRVQLAVRTEPHPAAVVVPVLRQPGQHRLRRRRRERRSRTSSARSGCRSRPCGRSTPSGRS